MPILRELNKMNKIVKKISEALSDGEHMASYPIRQMKSLTAERPTYFKVPTKEEINRKIAAEDEWQRQRKEVQGKIDSRPVSPCPSCTALESRLAELERWRARQVQGTYFIAK